MSDTDLAKILFLSINPNKCGERKKLSDSSGNTKKRKRNCDNKDTVGTLIGKYQDALQNKSLKVVREQMKIQLMCLLDPNVNSNSVSNCKNYFDDNSELNETEEDILAFHEILEMFKFSTPEKIKQKYKSLINSLKFNERSNFFIFAENKLLLHICNKLDEQDVYKIYEILSDSATKDVNNDSATKDVNNEYIKDLSTTFAQLDEKIMKKVKGLKEVAFFHLVLTLMRSNYLNRLYTRPLQYALDKLIVINKDIGKDYSYLDDLKTSLDRYPVTSRPTGLCIIFCVHQDRPGSDKDLSNVKLLFENDFNYEVILMEDPTKLDVKSVTTKLNDARHKFYDSLVVFFMSHGDEKYLEVTDGDIDRRKDLIQPICDIKWFFKKPKLFFVQACADRDTSKDDNRGENDALPGTSPNPDRRGWRHAAGSNWQNMYGDRTDFASVNPKADTLVSNATMWHEPATRNENNGSIYINTLVDQLRDYGKKESIENVLHRVHINVNSVKHSLDGYVNWKQAPYFESSLQKAFIFPRATK